MYRDWGNKCNETVKRAFINSLSLCLYLDVIYIDFF